MYLWTRLYILGSLVTTWNGFHRKYWLISLTKIFWSFFFYLDKKNSMICCVCLVYFCVCTVCHLWLLLKMSVLGCHADGQLAFWAWQKIKYCDFFSHYTCNKCSASYDESHHWAVPTHTTSSYLYHISRSQQQQNNC